MHAGKRILVNALVRNKEEARELEKPGAEIFVGYLTNPDNSISVLPLAEITL